MESRENLEQNENKRSCQVFGTIKGIYGEA